MCNCCATLRRSLVNILFSLMMSLLSSGLCRYNPSLKPTECFDPIVAKPGQDHIPVMVYGSVVVSAALLRIFGKDVAELPLVATDRVNQGKGYFQAQFTCVETFLASMSMKHLVLPAAVDAEPMWTNKLGFRKTNHEQVIPKFELWASLPHIYRCNIIKIEQTCQCGAFGACLDIKYVAWDSR